MYAVFYDFHFGVKRCGKESFFPFHAFLQTHFRVTAFVDAADVNAVFCQCFQQQADDGFFQTVDTQRQRLYHQYVREFIYHQTGQIVRFPEDDTAGRSVNGFFAVIPCVLYPAAEECFVNDSISVAAHHADGDFGMMVVKTNAHGVAVEVQHRNHFPVDHVGRNSGDFVVEYPQSAGFEGTAFAFFQCNGRIRHGKTPFLYACKKSLIFRKIRLFVCAQLISLRSC